MQSFKHYVLTRFNAGLYSRYASSIKMPADQWMRHRLDLFKQITLPSMRSQTCQNFTWVLLVDPDTPQHYRDEISALNYPNITTFDIEYVTEKWEHVFQTGTENIIQTRIDNDDALDIHAIQNIQDSYMKDQSRRVIIFPYGYIIELSSRKLFVMEYWSNNSPTLIQPASMPKTVFQWDHSKINTNKTIPKEYIKDRSYWLQVVHSQNLLNSVKPNSVKKIHLDMPVDLKILSAFNLDSQNLPTS